MRGAIPGDCATIFALVDNLVLVLLQHGVEEVEGQVFLLLQRVRHQVVVTVEPSVTKLDRLEGIHGDEVRNMLLDEIFHFL